MTIVFVFPLSNLLAREKIKNSIPGKVIICGVCRDIEMAMPFSIKNVEKIGALFDDYRVFIYENDSTDRTQEMLQDWALLNSRVVVTTEFVTDEIYAETCFNKTWDNQFFRPDRIARARNIVLKQALDPGLDDYQYVIWLDLDFQSFFPYKEIIKTFQSKNQWDAVFPNGVTHGGYYYDTYALRDDVLPIGAELLGDEWWHVSGRRRLKLKKEDSWHPVYSAFGGLGIYKRDALKGCKYSACVTKDLEKWVHKIITSSKRKNQPEILLYYNKLSKTNEIHALLPPDKESPCFRNYDDGYLVKWDDLDGQVVFRLNSGVQYYPSVCEHVTLHATMILNGYDKLYINPALQIEY